MNIFLRDRLHISEAASSFTASSTDTGYAIDNAREADLFNSWKPTDGTADEWLQVDLGSTSVLGAAGAVAYCAFAYDARSANQTLLKLRYDSADNPAFTSPTALATSATLDVTMASCDFFGFVIPSTAKRYYRLYQLNADRGGGAVCAKILNWAMFKATDVLNATSFPKDSDGQYEISQVFHHGTMRTAGGLQLTNIYAKPGQRFGVTFQPATDALYASLRDNFFTTSGPARALYVQKEALKNAALADFYLCRMTDAGVRASRRYQGSYEMDMQFETEPWS